MHDHARILSFILERYTLPRRGYHGVVHWARVYENGVRLVASTGADVEIVALFALFHDSCRVNEARDDGHGLRGGELARSLRGALVNLEDARFELLHSACSRHTDGLISSNPTIASCWDADRLDLGRVGIRPHPDRLCSNAARDLLDWADERSCNGYEPVHVLRDWNIDLS